MSRPRKPRRSHRSRRALGAMKAASQTWLWAGGIVAVAIATYFGAKKLRRSFTAGRSDELTAAEAGSLSMCRSC